MHSKRALLPALGIALAFGGATAAWAQPTPEQAHALEGQITSWLATTMGSTIKLPPRPVQLSPEGDHYAVRVPLAPLVGKIDPPDAAFTATARPLDGTRWSLDDQKFPPLMTFTATETVPDPPDAKNPSPDGTHKEDVTYRVKLGQQDAHGVLDTSLATPTTSGGTLASMDLEKEGGAGASLTHIGPATTQTSTRPVDAQHTDLLSDMNATGYTVKTELPDGTTVALQAERVHIVSALSGLTHGKLVPLVHLASDLGKMIKAPGGDSVDGPTPEQKVKLHAMLEQARNMLTGGKLDESAEGVKFTFDGNSGSLAKAEISMDGEAPADTLTASMGFSMDGLVIDNLPPPIAAYVPTHFSIHPTISNVNLAVLTKMGLDATAPVPAGKTAPQPDMAALFAKGGIGFGFDTLALDVAGLKITGTGKFTSPNPKTVTGQAEFTASGLDTLIAKAQSDPLLQQAVPVVIFLKGIARTSGEQSVWQVTVNNTKVLVNGVDLSAMAGAFNK